jgi:predicted RNA-binding Zn-ribbon protein involved in translation (DUF1610 family)
VNEIQFKSKCAKEYIDKLQCPYCGSTNIYSESFIQTSDREVEKPWTCTSCKKTWSEKYVLNSLIDKDGERWILQNNKNIASIAK